MKKLLLVAALALGALAAHADQVPDVKAGKDMVGRNVGGTIVVDVLGTKTTTDLLATPLFKIVKPANSLVFTADLYSFDPSFGLHTTVTFTGTEYATGLIKWTVTDPSLVGTTVKVSYNGSTYDFDVTGFSGAIYTYANKLADPINETFDNVYRGSSLSMDNSLVSSININGTVSLVPVGITINPQVSGLAGVAVTGPFVKTMEWDGSYLTAGSSHEVTVFLNKAATANETISLQGSAPLSGPSSMVIAAGQSEGTFKVTVGAATAATPVWVTASLNGYSFTKEDTAGPLLLSVAPTHAGPYLSGSSISYTVTLSEAAPSAVTVALHSDSTNAMVPPTLVIPAGKSSGTFTVSVPPVEGSQLVIVTASLLGTVVKTTISLS